MVTIQSSVATFLLFLTVHVLKNFITFLGVCFILFVCLFEEIIIIIIIITIIIMPT